MIHMYLLLFLVSPTCPLLRSNQSRALAPCGQALSCFPFVFNLPVFTFCSGKELQNCLYQFPPELRFSTYTLHCLVLISHYFASHCTATIPPSLLATIHLETIPYPQIAPPQCPIGFILRSLLRPRHINRLSDNC